jgi:glycosyltransferase involved in cell wall biosynthesis
MEPLPTDPGDRRLMRGGMLCKALAARGHEVTWFTSTFDHYAKRQRMARSGTLAVSDNYRIELLRAPGYRRNGSPFRMWHNWRFARAFLDFARHSAQRPDVIVTDVPTTEAAQAAVLVGRRWGVPTLLSIRDLWPDFFGRFLPPAARPVLRLAIARFERQVAYACGNATAIIGISPRYLEWGLRKGGREQGPLDGVVPLGYEPVAAAAADPAQAEQRLRQLGVDPGKRLVSFVGSWGGTCDLDLVLAAAARLRAVEDVQFVLAGDGDSRTALLARIATLHNVVAPGWLTATEIAMLLENSALGLLPYRAEAPQGLPNKIFEYMAYGVFQISTLPGEADETLTALAAGRTVAAGDAASMADAIVESLEKAAGAGERERIRGEFDARYSAAAVYADLSERIERLAGAATPPAP